MNWNAIPHHRTSSHIIECHWSASWLILARKLDCRPVYINRWPLCQELATWLALRVVSKRVNGVKCILCSFVFDWSIWICDWYVMPTILWVYNKRIKTMKKTNYESALERIAKVKDMEALMRLEESFERLYQHGIFTENQFLWLDTYMCQKSNVLRGYESLRK